jgi:hypothetical protein
MMLSLEAQFPEFFAIKTPTGRKGVTSKQVLDCMNSSKKKGSIYIKLKSGMEDIKTDTTQSRYIMHYNSILIQRVKVHQQ